MFSALEMILLFIDVSFLRPHLSWSPWEAPWMEQADPALTGLLAKHPVAWAQGPLGQRSPCSPLDCLKGGWVFVCEKK